MPTDPIEEVFRLAWARSPSSPEPHQPKDSDMSPKLTWFDRLLLKVAIAKAVARGASGNPESLARALKGALLLIREP